MSRSIFDFLGLPPQANDINGVEYYGGIGFLKAGLANADAITTVSPTYAKEIRDPGFGMGLEGLIHARAAVVSGIVNGIDASVWNPAPTPALAARYDHSIWKAARATRRPSKPASAWRLATGPLFTVISRLTWQKGMDVLVDQLDTLASLGGRLAVLGTGEAKLEARFPCRGGQASRTDRRRHRL